MISLALLSLYILLEILRPEALFPGRDWNFMMWIATAVTISSPLETLVAGKGLQQPRATWFALALLLVGVLSTALACWRGDSIFSNAGELAKAVFLYLVIVQTVYTERRIRIIRLVTMIPMLTLAVGGVLFGLGYEVPGFRWEPRVNRMQYVGNLQDSNDLGLIYAVGWSFLIYGVVNGDGWIRRTLAVLALVPFGWSIYLTVSRGAMLAALAGSFIAIRQRRGTAFSGALVALLLVGMIMLGVGRMGQLNSDEESADGRIRAWTQGWYMLRSNPLLGVGPQNFTLYHQRAAHSSLVQIAAETGFLGLFCWLGLFFVPLSRVPPLRLKTDDYTFLNGQFYGGLVACMIAALFLSRAYVFVPYLLAALTLASQSPGAQEYEPEAAESGTATVPRYFWRLAALQMLVTLVWRFSIRHYVEGI